MSILVTTARDILLSALLDIGVHMDETSIGATDEEEGAKMINRLMSALDANGVDLGFTLLTNISDQVTIPLGVMDALVSILALRLWPSYKTAEASADIVENARAGYELMSKIGVSIRPTEYPNTLPIGSGNTNPGDTYSAFYTGEVDEDILAESNGSISLEDSTNDE